MRDEGGLCEVWVTTGQLAVIVSRTVITSISWAQVDTTTFVTFAIVAMLVKFVGVISSAYAWNLLLKGQGVRYPFWSKIMTAFLIGRFIGTFLPSTLGLDGYTLYEAGRYSNQWPRVITSKALEKFIGVAGLFLGMVVTLPFGELSNIVSSSFRTGRRAVTSASDSVGRKLKH